MRKKQKTQNEKAAEAVRVLMAPLIANTDNRAKRLLMSKGLDAVIKDAVQKKRNT